MNKAEKGNAKIYVSYLTIAELYHIISSEFSRRKANEAVAALKRWPISFVPVSESIALATGRMMVQEGVAIQDAVVIATALEKGAALVTSDQKLGKAFKDTIIIGGEKF